MRDVMLQSNKAASSGRGPTEKTNGPRVRAVLLLGGLQAQLTLTALQARATALYWAEPVPYRSAAAFNVSTRAFG